MTWFGIFLVVYWVVNAFAYVALIGKSWRVTPEMALGMIIVYGLLIWGAVTVGTVHP